MGSKRLVVTLGLVVLLLVTGSIVGCGPTKTDQPMNGESANPLEDITNPNDSDDETETTAEMSISSEDMPEGPMVADGTIEKLTGNTFDLRQEKIELVQEGGVWKQKPGSQPEIKMWQVVFNSSTEVLWLKVSSTGKMYTEEASAHDIKEGRKAYIWGEVDGNRIFADSIALRPF